MIETGSKECQKRHGLDFKAILCIWHVPTLDPEIKCLKALSSHSSVKENGSVFNAV